MTMTSFVPNIGWVPPSSVVSGTNAESQGCDPSFDSSSNSAAINRALAKGGLVTLMTPGTYFLSCDTRKYTSDGNTYNVALFIPSYTTFVVGNGVTLKMAPGVNNGVLIQNSDIGSGNTDIEISGGIWDGNANSVTKSYVGDTGKGSWASIAIWMQNITNLKLHDMTVKDPVGWGIGLSNLNGFNVYNISRIDTQTTRNTATNQDGIDVVGPNQDGRISNIYSNSMDDVVAFLADQGNLHGSGLVNTMAGYGSQSNIVVENIRMRESDGAWNAIKFMDSTTNPISDIVVRGISGSYINSVAQIGSNSVPNTTSLIRNVSIENVDCSAFSTAPIATINIVGSIESLYLRNTMRTCAATETAAPLFLVSTIAAAVNVSSLTIDQFFLKNLNNAGTSWFNMVSSTVIADLNIIGGNVVTPANGGPGSGNFVNVAGGATCSRMVISKCKANNAQRFVALDGLTTSVTLEGNVFYGPTSPSAEAIRIRGTVPLLHMVGNYINVSNGGAGNTTGVINLNGSVGTTAIKEFGNTFIDAGTTVTRVASETLRWQGISDAVNSNIIASLVGDMFIDSNSGFGIICTSAAQGYKQL